MYHTRRGGDGKSPGVSGMDFPSGRPKVCGLTKENRLPRSAPGNAHSPRSLSNPNRIIVPSLSGARSRPFWNGTGDATAAMLPRSW